MSELLNEFEAANFYKYPIVNKCMLDWMIRSRQWHIVFGGFMHNHMTHNLAVIGSLGLDEELANEKLQWWYELYSGKHAGSATLEPSADYESRSQLIINASNWKDHVLPSEADVIAYYSFLRYFDARIKEEGYESVVREHLPYLVSGMAGSAVHSIIHLGFALEVKSDTMIAEGLACMCIYYLDLGSAAPKFLSDISKSALHQNSDSTNLIEASIEYISKAYSADYHATAVSAMNTTFASFPLSGFQKRLRAFTDVAHLADSYTEQIPLKISTVFEAVKQATALIACAYLASNNEFFVIHGLTSLHGLIVSLQFLSVEAQKNALVCWWKIAMAVLVIQSVIANDQIRVPLLERLQLWQAAEAECKESVGSAEIAEEWWAHILSIAVTSTEEHASKGCYVLYRWSHFAGMPAHSLKLFQQVAENQVKDCPENGNPAKNIWFSG